MKAFNIILIIVGIIVLISGFMELGSGDNGDFLGFQLDSPWYGILHIVLGSVMLR